MQVKALREALADLPDDAEVIIRLHNGDEWQKLWKYQTRELQNAYQARDDRFDQSQCLTLEVGDYHNH